jgi:uncharacterized Zn finger protein
LEQEGEGMTELKPCPFCGEDLFKIKSLYAPFIKCEYCGTMRSGHTLDECIEQWNRRVIE